jgi:hypothetical protein
MIRPAVFLAASLVFVTSAKAQTAEQPKETPVIRMLYGTWQGPACGGDWTYRADGTFEAQHYSPGNNQLTGTWAVRWNSLPPTLVRTCKTSDDPDLVGKTWEVRLIQLDGVDLAYQYPDQYPSGHLVRFTRSGKTPEQEPEMEDAAQSLRGMIYGPLREDGSRDVTIRKDAVGKRVIVEGIAWGQPFGRKGQEGTISPWAGPQVVHQGGSVFVKGIDFTETKARGKPVRVSGILRLDPGTNSRFGDLKPYYFIEATTFEPLDAVTDPYLVLAKE